MKHISYVCRAINSYFRVFHTNDTVRTRNISAVSCTERSHIPSCWLCLFLHHTSSWEQHTDWLICSPAARRHWRRTAPDLVPTNIRCEKGDVKQTGRCLLISGFIQSALHTVADCSVQETDGSPIQSALHTVADCSVQEADGSPSE
jgi:hypothetical protein